MYDVWSYQRKHLLGDHQFAKQIKSLGLNSPFYHHELDTYLIKFHLDSTVGTIFTLAINKSTHLVDLLLVLESEYFFYTDRNNYLRSMHEYSLEKASSFIHEYQSKIKNVVHQIQDHIDDLVPNYSIFNWNY